LVQTEAASPYSTPLAQRSASASALKRWTLITGPNTSFWTISSSCRSLPKLGSAS
jgi:hypothetical protein